MSASYGLRYLTRKSPKFLQATRPGWPDAADRHVERGGNLSVVRRRCRDQHTQQLLTARRELAEGTPEPFGAFVVDRSLLGIQYRLLRRRLVGVSQVEQGRVVGWNDTGAATGDP